MAPLLPMMPYECKDNRLRQSGGIFCPPLLMDFHSSGWKFDALSMGFSFLWAYTFGGLSFFNLHLGTLVFKASPPFKDYFGL
jgi:hypothetical protein